MSETQTSTTRNWNTRIWYNAPHPNPIVRKRGGTQRMLIDLCTPTGHPEFGTKEEALAYAQKIIAARGLDLLAININKGRYGDCCKYIIEP